MDEVLPLASLQLGEEPNAGTESIEFVWESQRKNSLDLSARSGEPFG